MESSPLTPIPETIGPYKILKKIGSGGMGEVFLAHDPFCKRSVALKRIRSDRIDRTEFKERFLKEVKITAQLSHPSIVPIYQIHQSDTEIYYTMPLVEGETLKEILKKTRHDPKHPLGSSIPALMRIFVSVCQAIAYSHKKGILHRDLKPENILIGSYGEVMVLDWGLSDLIGAEESSYSETEDLDFCDLTKPGKLAGTLSYIPPERVFGTKASYRSDVYALGVILYQLLTLRLPFQRKTVKEYRKQLKFDQFIDPTEKAPHRDIDPQLSKIAKKCLSPRPERRYQRVEEILRDLHFYTEGIAQWSPCMTLHTTHREDWSFQENIIFSRAENIDWVNLSLAKQIFTGNIKFELHIQMKESGNGIGFLLSSNSPNEKKDLFQDAFFFWIGSEQNPGCSLFHSNIEVMSNPELFLSNNQVHFLSLKKTDKHLKLYINHTLAIDFFHHIPFQLPKFGVVLKDHELEIGAILVSSSSPNIQINCLAVPDTLLSLRHYEEAFLAYEQIAKSFTGRSEAREAIFRSGIALLEQWIHQRSSSDLLEQALTVFGKLRNTPAAPLEYLGKSLVYKAIEEIEEEGKCLELALRKFENHPLRTLLKDQILFRLHETAYRKKNTSYLFALLTIHFIPEALQKIDHRKKLDNLYQSCPFPPFGPNSLPVLKLSFHLAHIPILSELNHSSQDFLAFLSLRYLGQQATHTSDLAKVVMEDPLQACLNILFFEKDPEFPYAVLFLVDFFYTAKNKQLFLKHLEPLKMTELPQLFKKKFKEKIDLFEMSLGSKNHLPWDLFSETCFLASTKGVEDARLFFLLEEETDPLFSFYLQNNKIPEEILLSEKIDLYQKCILFNLCAKQKSTAQYFQNELSHLYPKPENNLSD